MNRQEAVPGEAQDISERIKPPEAEGAEKPKNIKEWIARIRREHPTAAADLTERMPEPPEGIETSPVPDPQGLDRMFGSKRAAAMRREAARNTFLRNSNPDPE